MKIKIILGSTRQGRFGEKIAAWVMDQVKLIPNVEFELLDLRDYPMPFFDEPISPSQPNYNPINKTVIKWTEKIAEGEAFLVITPEYNHGYPAVLKNALDYVHKQWGGKKITFVSYGVVGGARSVEQLRQVVIELNMIPLKQAIYITKFWELQNFDQYTPNLKSIIGQLI